MKKLSYSKQVSEMMTMDRISMKSMRAAPKEKTLARQVTKNSRLFSIKLGNIRRCTSTPRKFQTVSFPKLWTTVTWMGMTSRAILETKANVDHATPFQ